MGLSTTVLVVGGGATGAGVARDLALRGIDVTLIERGGLASGTTGRSHGLLHSGARYAEADRVGAEECIVENRILRDIAGACIDETGGLFVQLPDDDPSYLRRNARRVSRSVSRRNDSTRKRPTSTSRNSCRILNGRCGFLMR